MIYSHNLKKMSMQDVHFTVENWFLKGCFWYSKQIFQGLPGDCDALLSGRPS